jgi:flagellar basal body rod protein FlgG
MDLLGTLNTGLSGMIGAQTRLGTQANNVANMETSGFQSSRANLAELPEGGVEVDSITTDTTNAGMDADGAPLSNVDPASEMVQMKLDSWLYDANASVVSTADSMMGNLLDVMSSCHS